MKNENLGNFAAKTESPANENLMVAGPSDNHREWKSQMITASK